MNFYCQDDLIDIQAQSDGEYKFILVYPEHLIKYVIYCPSKYKQSEEVPYVQLDIFMTIETPSILQSDNGREFANQFVSEL